MTGADDGDRKYGASTVAERGPGGQFVAGNPGRPRGSRNKASLAAEAVLERGGRAVARKAVELAKAGDVAAIKLVLERLVPARRDRPISVALPAVRSAADHPAALAALVEAVASGDLAAADARAVADVLAEHRRATETVDLDARIAALEQGRVSGPGDRK